MISKCVLTWCDENGIKIQDVKTLEKAKRSGKAYISINGAFGLPTPYELTGDERWSPDGELNKEYDLELADAADQVSLNDAVVEVTQDIVDDRDKVIDFSKMHQALGVKALSEKSGFENKKMGDNGRGSAIYSEISEERFADEISGILSFN